MTLNKTRHNKTSIKINNFCVSANKFINLLVVTERFDNPLSYSATELTAIGNFLNNGGDVLMITESANQNDLNNYNALLAGIGSSISFTGQRFEEITILNPNNDPLSTTPIYTGYYNTLAGGNALYGNANGVVVSYEAIGSVIPVPAAIWLFGSALAGLGWLRRR